MFLEEEMIEIRQSENWEDPAWLVARLKKSRSWVYNGLAQGKIPSVVFSAGMSRRSYRVLPSEIDTWLESHRSGPWQNSNRVVGNRNQSDAEDKRV